jgi:hypothetical protein
LYVPVEFHAKDVQKNSIHSVKLTGLAGEGEKLILTGELIC